MEQRKLNLEQLAKQFVRNICDKCMPKMLEAYPKMNDCAYRHYNDEHLCYSMNSEMAIKFVVYLLEQFIKENEND